MTDDRHSLDGDDADKTVIVQAVQRWLQQVVIGLNLCPFAADPHRNQQIRIQVSVASHEEALLAELQAELRLLDRLPAATLETTLLVIPHLLSNFDDYLQFLDWGEELLHAFGWETDYQIASFHPQYCFAGTVPEDAENLTNRSPYPILHILREASVDRALASYQNPEKIPERNIHRVRALTQSERQQLFAYLSSPSAE